jgi:uncharacterized membrane protein
LAEALHTNKTTATTTAAQVELFDVALVDGTHFVPISHSIVKTSANDDDDEASYVGVAVAIPVAVALVLLVIGAALAIGWRRKRVVRRSEGIVHFEGGADDQQEYDDEL